MYKHDCEYCECEDYSESEDFIRLTSKYSKAIDKLNNIADILLNLKDDFDRKIENISNNLRNIVESRCDKLTLIMKEVCDIYDQKFISMDNEIKSRFEKKSFKRKNPVKKRRVAIGKR